MIRPTLRHRRRRPAPARPGAIGHAVLGALGYLAVYMLVAPLIGAAWMAAGWLR